MILSALLYKVDNKKTTLPVWSYFGLERIKDTYKLKMSLLARSVTATVYRIACFYHEELLIT